MPKIVYHDSEGVEKSVELGSEPTLIGRSTECQIQTQDALVSRRHARIVYDGFYWIEDLGSANGVYVDSQKVQRAQLRPGDQALCGSLALRFEADVAAAIRRTQGLNAVTDDMLANSSATPLRSTDTSAGEPPPTPPAPASSSVVVSGSVVSGSVLTGSSMIRVRPPQSAPPPLSVVPPPSVPSSTLPSAGPPSLYSPPPSAQADAALRAELDSERRRRTDAEFDRDEARRALAELTAKHNAEQNAKPAGSDNEQEVARLQRKNEQLEADMRRLRGKLRGEPSELPVDPRIAELEEKARRLELERDEALRRATIAVRPVTAALAAAPDPKLVDELERARRQIDQLQSDLRRRASQTQTGTPTGELEAALRQLRDVERERDALRAVVASGTRPKLPARVGECLSALGDGLADMRGAVKATGDEMAVEQLEQARNSLKEIIALLGLDS